MDHIHLDLQNRFAIFVEEVSKKFYVIIMLISKRLGTNIKKIRTIKKMSQGDTCRSLNMDRGYMSAIENGKKNITISQLERLAQALGVSVDKLLK